MADIDELCDEIGNGLRTLLGEKFAALIESIHEETESQKDTDEADGETYASDNVVDEDYTSDEARDFATDAYNDGWSAGFDRATEILREVIDSAKYLGWMPAPRTTEPAAPVAV